MSLKKRFQISFLLMIVSTVILMYISSKIILSCFMHSNAKFFNITRFKTFAEITVMNEEITRKINLQVLEDVDKFKDLEYVETLNKEVEGYTAIIIVRKGDSVIYPSDFYEQLDNKVSLPKFGEIYDGIFTSGKDNVYGIKQYDFYFKDNSEGSIFIIMDIMNQWEYIKLLQTVMGISAVIIIIFIICIFSYAGSKHITRPLRELKYAANKIKEGNLDYEIKHYAKDEIGEVSIAFEEMRHRLKQSMNMQLQYEENRKKLISNISHDLKTPITAIKGYVEGIKDGVADTPEKMDRYVNTIYLKACHMDNLINELFLFSKLDLKKVSFDFQSIDITAYLKDCIEELKFDLEKRNINLNFSCTHENIVVMADVQKIKRVIMNIIQNSIKYMNKEVGQIDIFLGEKERFAVIEIKDNGKGISNKALPFVFNRFYRGDSHRNSSTGGSGLGLAIAQQIIEEHDGQIWVESEVSKGTSIFFTLKKDSKWSENNEKNSNH